MADRLGQVTIPASGKIQLAAGIPSTVNPNLSLQALLPQNNGTHNMRFGDTTVSSTRGIILYPSTSEFAPPSLQFPIAANTMLSDWWVQGTPGDVLDFIFIGG